MEGSCPNAGSGDLAGTFAWRAGDRNLVEINLTTGAATPIGQTHRSTSHANQPVRAFFSAPGAELPVAA